MFQNGICRVAYETLSEPLRSPSGRVKWLGSIEIAPHPQNAQKRRITGVQRCFFERIIKNPDWLIFCQSRFFSCVIFFCIQCTSLSGHRIVLHHARIRQRLGGHFQVTAVMCKVCYRWEFQELFLFWTAYRYWKLIKSYKNNFYVSFLVHRVHFWYKSTHVWYDTPQA